MRDIRLMWTRLLAVHAYIFRFSISCFTYRFIHVFPSICFMCPHLSISCAPVYLFHVFSSIYSCVCPHPSFHTYPCITSDHLSACASSHHLSISFHFYSFWTSRVDISFFFFFFCFKGGRSFWCREFCLNLCMRKRAYI